MNYREREIDDSVNEVTDYSISELITAYRSKKVDAQKREADYLAMLAENAQLREQLEEQNKKLRKLNCFTPLIEVNPEVSRATRKSNGHALSLNLFMHQPDASYEDVQAVIDSWEGFIAGAIQIRGTKDATIRLKRKTVAEIDAVKEEREKQLKDKDKYGKKQKVVAKTAIDKLMALYPHLPPDEARKKAEESLAAMTAKRPQ